ncbi:dipeptidase [Xanthomonas sp. XNM01]|uniref:dipeptidase n=1 Tax=Xanthomonas sp. XNM01 TaxID=2769289 RepID=UPI0017806545|nr:dipeptidase [Xanthomonas sp. XNM01]MBD9367604.1 membrane dipeptidase [Xanthomonas sp. XNM01]
MTRLLLATTLALGLLPVPLLASDAVPAAARALHERILTLDSHLDTPLFFGREGWDILERNDHGHAASQVDYPRLVEGGLDGGIWVIYTGQRGRTPADDLAARDHGLARLVEIRELLAAHPDKFELAVSADDAARIKRDGKRVVYIGIENASPLSADPSLLGLYHRLGVRVLGLVHTSNNDFADSASTPAEWNGLSPKGRALVAEANRLGIVLDQSHASDAVFDQLLELSTAPIILSHTGADAVFEHPRNIDDARIRKLAGHGGVILVNSLGSYLIDTGATPAYQADLRALYERFGGRAAMRESDYPEFDRLRAELDAKHGLRKATLDDYFAHILHILEVAGPEHVGFGADWDGGGGVIGLEDISDLPKITARLLQEGYTEQQIEAIWSGNLLRVIRQAQAVAEQAPAATR